MVQRSNNCHAQEECRPTVSVNLLCDLPVEILHQHVLSRLPPRDVESLSRVCLSLRRFVRGLRKGAVVLRPDALERFFEDAAFRERVVKLVPRLAMNAIPPSVTAGIVDAAVFRGVHTVTLRGCDSLVDVSALGEAHTVTLSSCKNVRNVDALRGAHTVVLDSCSLVQDISALGGVHTLRVAWCTQLRPDVRALGGVHTLSLTCNWFFRSAPAGIRALAGVHTLQLHVSSCEWDASCLAAVHSLDLGHVSSGLRGVAALGGAHTLRMDGPNAHRYVAELVRGLDSASKAGKQMHALTLTSSHVTDVKGLGVVHTLDLSGNRSLEDVSSLGGVHVLDLSRTSVKDVSALGGVHTLVLTECPLLRDVSALGGVHTIDIMSCPLIENISALCRVPRIRCDTSLVEGLRFRRRYNYADGFNYIAD